MHTPQNSKNLLDFIILSQMRV